MEDRQGRFMKSRAKTGTVVYTARTRTTSGRDHGVSLSSDGYLDVRLAAPGSARIGTNPEQLFAASWSASFANAIGLAARKKKVKLQTDATIDAEIDLHPDDNGYFVSARLNVGISGIERRIAQELVNDAKVLCPYSRATKGNIAVTYTVA
jgi:Ohr subfamily peroxiredoxin